MALSFNGVNIPSGVKQYFNGTQLSEIRINDVRVWLYDNVAPTITVTSSTANTVSASYTLTGTVVDTESGVATLKINNVDVTWNASSGAFSKTYTLSSGNNTFTIVSTDGAGNSATKSVTINYINQKDNTSYNWSNFDGQYVTVNGTSYRIFYELGGGDGTGYPSGYGSLNTSGVPIPKGVSSMTFNMYDDGSIGRPGDVRGGICTVTIRDTTTGTTIATKTIQATRSQDSHTPSSGEVSGTLTVNLNATQTTHNIVLDVSGEMIAGGSGYYWGNLGIKTYSFTYYS